MIPLSLGQIADIVGGRVVDAGTSEVVVTGPAFLDTRTPEPGGLFVAFEGEHVDGHDFASAAVEGGAAAVLGTRAWHGRCSNACGRPATARASSQSPARRARPR